MGESCPPCSCRRIPFEDCTSCKNPNNALSVCSTAAAGQRAEYVSTVRMPERPGPGESKHEGKDGARQRDKAVDVDEGRRSKGKQKSRKGKVREQCMCSKRRRRRRAVARRVMVEKKNQGVVCERKNLQKFKMSA